MPLFAGIVEEILNHRVKLTIKSKSVSSCRKDIEDVDQGHIALMDQFRKFRRWTDALLQTGPDQGCGSKFGQELLRHLQDFFKVCDHAFPTLLDRLKRETLELERINKKWQASWELYQAVFEDSHDGIIITTRSSKFLAVNQGFVNFYSFAFWENQIRSWSARECFSF